MSMVIQDIQRWLDEMSESFGSDACVGVDDGGLVLELEEHSEFYLEIGGTDRED